MRSRGAEATNCDTIIRFFGPDTPVTEIDRQAVVNFIGFLRNPSTGRRRPSDRPLRPATINRKLSTLRGVLKACVHWGELPALPRDLPAKLKGERSRQFVFSEAQELAFVEAARGWDSLPDPKPHGRPRVRDGAVNAELFTFLIETGLRLGEALKLRWDDISLDRRYAGVGLRSDFPVKTARSARRVPLTARCLQLLERLVARGQEGPFAGLNKRRAQETFAYAKKVVGLTDRDCVVHAFRHTCATRLLEVTGDIALVSR
jgi:integrase